MPSCTCKTGSLVARPSNSVIALSWVGSRWGTSTNAIPERCGIAFISSMNASRPPAEAPTPTTGKLVVAGAWMAVAFSPVFLGEDFFLLWDTFFLLWLFIFHQETEAQPCDSELVSARML